MKINSKIFKAYDVRGVYPNEINEETAYAIGRAFVLFLKKKNPKIVIGRDNRFSSPILFKNLSKGIIEQGGDVVDIGLSITPMLYFAAGHFNYDGGIQITASHNPSQYNGLKMVRDNAISISGQSGLKEIKKIAMKGNFKKAKKGKIYKKKILKDYIDFNLKRFDLKKIKPLRVVVDTANAVSGILIEDLFKKTNLKVSHLFKELDGSFPNHPPDPLKKENLRALYREVKLLNADLGVAFDGDGDRVVFMNELGKQVPGDLITALMAELTLKERKKGKIIYDLRSSNIVKETIKNMSGRPVISKVGHSLIKNKMRKEGIFFAGEFSGHYYYDDDYFSECPIFVLFKILEEISETGKSFSQIIKPFQKYFHSGEKNFKIKDKEKTLKILEQNFKSGKLLKLDGLRVDFDDWWFLVRASNTEPLIRLVVEAKTKTTMDEKIKEISKIIEKN